MSKPDSKAKTSAKTSKNRKTAALKAAAAKTAAPKAPVPKAPVPKAPVLKAAVAKPKALPLDEAILDALTRSGKATLSPPEIAHVIEPEGDDWHALLSPIRHAVVKMALAERLVIYRKGKPVEDPNDFRGVYRLGLPKTD